MQWFFTGVLCLLVLYMLSGCTTLEDTINRLAQKSRVIFHPEAKAADQTPKTSETCVLDPVVFRGVQQLRPLLPRTRRPLYRFAETAYDFGTIELKRMNSSISSA